MIITINKDTKPEEIDAALKKLPKSKKKSLTSFYGKLKGSFGDGLAYQKKVRDEWDQVSG
jgi:hypothetical protein